MTHTQVRGTRKGFTLIEIMIALVIIGIIGAIVLPNLYKALATGQDSATRANLRALKSAIGQFYLSMGGQHPDRLRDLVKKPQEEKFAKKWTEPYLDAKNIPDDGLGNPFKYAKQGKEGNQYELYSYGPGGKSGPKDERISVWDL